MSDHQRRVYLNHIRRLQERNRLLSEMLAEERHQRRRASAWYRKRLESRMWSLVDMLTLSSKGWGE